MSLKAELDAFRSEFMAQTPPEIRDAMVRADMELAASGIAQRALKAGDRAPDFSLPDARGGYVRLNGSAGGGPGCPEFLPRRLVPILQSRTAGIAASPS